MPLLAHPYRVASPALLADTLLAVQVHLPGGSRSFPACNHSIYRGAPWPRIFMQIRLAYCGKWPCIWIHLPNKRQFLSRLHSKSPHSAAASSYHDYFFHAKLHLSVQGSVAHKWPQIQMRGWELDRLRKLDQELLGLVFDLPEQLDEPELGNVPRQLFLIHNHPSCEHIIGTCFQGP